MKRFSKILATLASLALLGVFIGCDDGGSSGGGSDPFINAGKTSVAIAPGGTEVVSVTTNGTMLAPTSSNTTVATATISNTDKTITITAKDEVSVKTTATITVVLAGDSSKKVVISVTVDPALATPDETIPAAAVRLGKGTISGTGNAPESALISASDLANLRIETFVVKVTNYTAGSNDWLSAYPGGNWASPAWENILSAENLVATNDDADFISAAKENGIWFAASSGLSATVTVYYIAEEDITPGDFTVTATPATNSISLTWTEAENAKSYTVYYKKASDSIYITGATVTTTSATISDLSAATDYDIKVTAKHGNGSKDALTTAKTKEVTGAYKTITLDGAISETEGWTKLSEDSYSDANTQQNMKALYVTNDADNLYVAIEYVQAPAGNKTNISLAFDTAATKNNTEQTGAWMTPATTTTYSNDGYDVFFYDDIEWVADAATNQQKKSDGLSSSVTYGPAWDSEANGYVADSAVVEYKVSLSSIGSVGDTIKVFTAISQYAWTDVNTETLLDCIPAGAATVSNESTTLAVDFSAAASYTIK
ncbi:MAG: fibronectin type III domain-containing protein [Treponema sp.]|nr:fibronectin type III domain-containing protein [Treponema sp.]